MCRFGTGPRPGSPLRRVLRLRRYGHVQRMTYRPDKRSTAERAVGRPWRKWYLTPAWRQIRARQLARQPWCVRCWAQGKQVRASVTDHVVPHRGDAAAFWDTGNLQSLCMSCHSADKQQREALGYSTSVGADGWPTDPRHYANTGCMAVQRDVQVQTHVQKYKYKR